ncbi:MAG: DUF6020 family protein [Lachnospiraceae bacterium]
MKARLSVFFKAFLTAFALLTVFHAPLNPAHYETGIDYAIASIYELLGNYDFTFILLLILCAGFYFFLGERELLQKKASTALAAFFAFCLLLGQSYYEMGTWEYCFGSIVNFIKFVLALVGYIILFRTIMALLLKVMEERCFTENRTHFFSSHAFLKSFLIIMAAYSPFLILSFPGNLCWDVIGQIEQVILQTGYSTHHPLAHTLIVGGFTKMGQVLFHSYEIGLFLYMLFQASLLVAALAATIAVLAKRQAKLSLLICLLVLYCITPVYSNVASTALKDVPFCAFVIGYVICLALLLETPSLLKNRKFVVGFVLLQVGVILFRNNGLPLVLLSGVCTFIFLFKKYQMKERIFCFFVSFGAGILIARLLLLILVQICAATPGSKGEMLSIPFQQTARYLQCYRNELDEEEKAAIEAVLGDVDTVALRYDPTISDPVKALFYKDATQAEIINYLKVWCKGFFKHPAVYLEAFFVHVYGWFTPSVSNAIRYEASYDVIRQGGLFPNAEKILIFYYRFANRFTLLGVLENIGVAVWGLFFLTFYQKRRHYRDCIFAGIPLWVSLLVCMASPCFFGHPRYAFPILFTLPFLFGFTLSRKDSVTVEDR